MTTDLRVVRDELNIHGEISGVSAEILFAEIGRLQGEWDKAAELGNKLLAEAVRLRAALWEIAGDYQHPCMDAHDAWDTARKAIAKGDTK